MIAGYDVSNLFLPEHTVIEVINNRITNHVINLGWRFERTIRLIKNKNSVGIWKIKKLKK